VWGGLNTGDNKNVDPLIYSAPILADGNIGKWSTENTALPVGFYRCAGTASGNYLMSFCPSYAGGSESNDIWYTEVNDTGVSSWKKLKTNLNVRVYFGVAPDFRRGVIYLPGGRITRTKRYFITGDCYYFKLSGSSTTPAPSAPDMLSENVNQYTAASSSQPSYMYMTTSGIVPGFMSYETARQLVYQKHLPLVIYFHASQARPCQEQIKQLQGFDTAPYQNQLLFAAVESSQLPQLCHQFGVFRAPCWLLFNNVGQVTRRKIGILSADDLKRWLSGN
jgi:hypothetical protein